MSKKITVKTVDEIENILKKKIKEATSQALLNEVGDYMVKEVVFRFKNNQIKPKTKTVTLLNRRAKGYKRIKDAKKAATRAKLLGGALTLVDTGKLMRSIRHKVFYRRKYVAIGTNVEYAAIHQFGGRTGKRKSVKLPARPFLYFTAVNRIQIMRIVRSYVEEF